jgi:hypothetical protein
MNCDPRQGKGDQDSVEHRIKGSCDDDSVTPGNSSGTLGVCVWMGSETKKPNVGVYIDFCQCLISNGYSNTPGKGVDMEWMAV